MDKLKYWINTNRGTSGNDPVNYEVMEDGNSKPLNVYSNFHEAYERIHELYETHIKQIDQTVKE